MGFYILSIIVMIFIISSITLVVLGFQNDWDIDEFVGAIVVDVICVIAFFVTAENSTYSEKNVLKIPPSEIDITLEYDHADIYYNGKRWSFEEQSKFELIKNSNFYLIKYDCYNFYDEYVGPEYELILGENYNNPIKINY